MMASLRHGVNKRASLAGLRTASTGSETAEERRNQDSSCSRDRNLKRSAAVAELARLCGVKIRGLLSSEEAQWPFSALRGRREALPAPPEPSPIRC